MRNFCDPACKEDILGCTQHRLELAEEHLNDPLAALAESTWNVWRIPPGSAFGFTVCRCQALYRAMACSIVGAKILRFLWRDPIGKASGLTCRMLWVCAQQECTGKYVPHAQLFSFLVKKEPFAFTKAVE